VTEREEGKNNERKTDKRISDFQSHFRSLSSQYRVVYVLKVPTSMIFRFIPAYKVRTKMSRAGPN